MSSEIINSNTDLGNVKYADTNIWIINYDILKKHFHQLSNIHFDCIVGDEATYIKTIKAIRTKAFRALSRNINSVIMLSGTPLLSRPSELFSMLNIIDPQTWNNWWEFAKTFCDMKQTRWGIDTSGASNTEELHKRIKRYFIRRLKSEVLDELPEKIFINVPVELEKTVAKEYDAAANSLAEYLRSFAGKQTAEINKAMAAEKLTQLNILRQLCALGKIDTTKEMIENIIDSGEKVLVFSSFVAPLEELKSIFGKKAVMITGMTPAEERGDIVEKFQEDKNIQVFLGGYKSAGLGITLTAAQNFMGIDYPWNPADLQQAIDRLHRPGAKTNSVNIYQLSALGTVDEDMAEILDKKQGIFDQVIEGRLAKDVASNAMESAVNRILKNY
jgi:SWI/SNF-related matrix-associated actin-dependent regulator 1 of chromatin subfamily A